MFITCTTTQYTKFEDYFKKVEPNSCRLFSSTWIKMSKMNRDDNMIVRILACLFILETCQLGCMNIIEFNTLCLSIINIIVSLV